MEEQRQEKIIENHVLLLWLDNGAMPVIFIGSQEETNKERKRICGLVNRHRLVDFPMLGESIPNWRILSIKSIPELQYRQKLKELEELRKEQEEKQELAQEELEKFKESQQQLLDTPFDSGGAAVDILKKKD